MGIGSSALASNNTPREQWKLHVGITAARRGYSTVSHAATIGGGGYSVFLMVVQSGGGEPVDLGGIKSSQMGNSERSGR